MQKFLWLFAVLVIGVGSDLRAQQQRPYVVLVSFDGFRFDYVEKYNPPNFISFIEKGSKAEAMIPVFPSKTFPNHYSIVTGLYPNHHGLVDNYFFDSQRKEHYTSKSKERVRDSYFYGGTPLWKLAQQQGVKSASYFWVGSEMSEEGCHPDYYYSYDGAVPYEARVDKVLEWLALPESERPHFITLYFSSPDQESDDYGPLGEGTRKAIFQLDSLLGKLMKGIAKTNLPVNVILLSDHGTMELEVKDETFIFLDELFDIKSTAIEFVTSGSQAHIYLKNPSQLDSLYNVLKSKQNNFRVLKRSEFPARWHYDHERSGDLLIVADPGHYIYNANRAKYMQGKTLGQKFGAHGYDPVLTKDVLGIFYAQGPNIKKGIQLTPFENINVYPFIARILKLTPPPIDGDPKVLNKLYKE